MSIFEELFKSSSIVAPKRDNRPFINESELKTCPFCLTNKQYLERIIDESWQNDELMMRIVSNRYPITSMEGARGIHDVVIDTGHHCEHPKDFSLFHWQMLLEGIQKRWRTLMENENIQMIQVFKNFGEDAGASISHSHWQIIALEAIPHTMMRQYENYESRETCYLCHKAHQKEGHKVWETDLFEVWVPPVMRFPYEVWVIPKKHHQHYGELSLDEIKELGKLLKYLLQVYHQIHPDYDFNICMMSGMLSGEKPYHFYVQLVMRMGHIAGFEIATGCHILSMLPEAYANQMKKGLKGMYK